MSLFRPRLPGTYSSSTGKNVKRHQLDRMICGATCKKCSQGNPGCTKALGHGVMAGHFSSGGDDGCGHRWDD